MTLDIEDHTTIDQTLEVLFELRRTHPDVGVAIQAMLLRTPKDLAELTGPGSRVRLVKGAYDEPDERRVHRPAIRSTSPTCGRMKILMYGKGYPMIGSHDPRMVAIAAQAGRRRGPHPRPLGTPDAVRDPPRRAGTAGQRPVGPCGSTCPTAPTGTATSPAGSPSAPPTCCSSCDPLATKG